MDLQAVTTSPADADASLVVVGATVGADGPVVAGDLGDLDVDVAAALEAVAFTGKVDTTARFPLPNGGSLLVVGCGEEMTAERVRALGATATRTGRAAATAAVVLPPDATDGGQALAEGLLLGTYVFDAHKSEREPIALQAITVHGGAAQDALEAGRVIAEQAMLTRDLVNTPPNFKRPPALAARVRELVEGTGLTVEVLDGEALRAGGYGGLIAVGQGSEEPPHLVEVRWAPQGATGDHVVLVGKGITFDTGGISLKPSSSMETMKMDMGGAATVLAVVMGVARLGLPVRMTAVLCLAENMPSGTAQRVSDVYTSLSGTTVEVMNTDAEGRLVLADGITHAGRIGADVIVDVATLTGAAVVALGDAYSAVLSNDDDLAGALIAAGTAADEPMWQLPLATAAYAEKLESTVADVKNVGGRVAGTITAGLFLHRFVPEGARWAHLDIAGTAWTDKANGIATKGATGNPVRALLAWARGLA